ncbi:unannotated protein [freshwater metagenome]|uniref:Unannotated protein n=1 Tax=freshwater metagenome TaxID=449393 RepID=A0A6J7UUM1_9ZZZZ
MRRGGAGTSSTTSTGRGCLGGRPRPRLCATGTPSTSSWPPHTPQGSARSTAPARQALASGHFEQIALARAMVNASSLKNRWASVPWPSRQRAFAQGSIVNETSADAPVAVPKGTGPVSSSGSRREMANMATVLSLGASSVGTGRVRRMRKAAGLFPAAFGVIFDVVRWLRRVPEGLPGGALGGLGMILRIRSNRGSGRPCTCMHGCAHTRGTGRCGHVHCEERAVHRDAFRLFGLRCCWAAISLGNHVVRGTSTELRRGGET